MDMLGMLANVVLAGLAAGGIGDLIAESTIFEKARGSLLKNNAPILWRIATCRFCVSAWASLMTLPLVIGHQPGFLFNTCLIAATWKVSTALRGWYG